MTKSILLILMAAACCAAARADVAIGDGRDQVVDTLGRPVGDVRLADKEILYYDRGTVDLRDGRVTAVNLVSEAEAEARKAQEEARQRDEARARGERMRAAENEKQKLLASESFQKLTPQEQISYWKIYKEQYPEASLPPEYDQAVAKVEAGKKPPPPAKTEVAAEKEPEKRLSASKRKKLDRKIKPPAPSGEEKPSY